MALTATGANTFATLNGMFKTVYADGLLNLIPEFAIVQKLVDFVPADKETGNYYSQPVVLASEAGFTYLGQSGATGTLTAAVAGVSKEAQVFGSELNLRAQLSYAALTRAASAGQRAFERVSKFKVQDMNAAMRKRLEIACLYGQASNGLGTVASATYDGTTYTNVVITDATWAGGIWAGLENAPLDFWTGTTKESNSPFQIAKVNSQTKTLSFLGNLASATNIQAGDNIFFYGARTGAAAWNEMAGLQQILNVSGPIFNIDNTQYSLWQGNVVTAVGNISLAKIQNAVSTAVNKGLMETLAVLVSPKAWAVLNTNEAALRMYPKAGDSFENGAEKLVFHSQNGKLEVYSHPFVKDGDVFMFPPDAAMRIGSMDLTFGRPGVDSAEATYFTTVPNTNALELQAMCDQAIFLEKPAHGIFMTGLTY